MKLDAYKKQMSNNHIIPIEDLPKLPEEIIEAYEHNKLVLFIGAGISRLMGCMSWVEMSNTLIRCTCNSALSEQIINSNLGNKEKITIAKRMAVSEHKEKDFWRIFAKAIKGEKKDCDIYNSIASLNVPIITTNCDQLIVKHFPKHNTTNCTLEEYEKHYDEPFVYCIHGLYGPSKKAKGSLIFTADEYLRRYADSGFKEFLRKVFFTNTVLFLGYGISEFELLSVIFPSDRNHEKNIKQHYALEGFYQYQKEYYEALSLYYESVGITLIPYSKDEKEYSQQIDIINNWIQELAQKSSFYSRGIDVIEKALENYNESGIEIIKHNLGEAGNTNKVLLNSILLFLPQKKNCFKWLLLLIDKDYIKPDDIVSGEDQNRFFQPNAILSSIAGSIKQISPTSTEKEQLSAFIKKCMVSVSSNERILNNYLITGDLVDIILQLNLPPTNDEEWLVITAWSERTYANITQLINNNISTLQTWEPNTLKEFLCSIYLPPKNTKNSIKAHWIPSITELIINSFGNDDEELISSIVVSCLHYYYEIERETDYYSCFADRMHSRFGEFSFQLIQNIEKMMKILSDDCKTQLLTNEYKTSDTALKYQTLLYLSKTIGCYSLSQFSDNPLKTSRTFVDFYLWIDGLVERKNLLSPLHKELLLNWVENATFGVIADNSFEPEIQERLKTRSNTRKYQLYELLIRIDREYYYQKYAYYQGLDRFNLKTPIEDIESYYMIREIKEPSIFPEQIDARYSAKELVGLVDDKISHNTLSPFFEIQDAYLELFRKISDRQLQELFEYGLQLSWSKLLDITSSIYYEDILKRLDQSFYQDFIRKIINRICSKKPKPEIRNRLLNIIVNSFDQLERIGWKHKQIATFLLEVNIEQFFDKTVIPDDQNIIIYIFTHSESEFYSLLIKEVYLCNDSLITKLFIDGLDEKVNSFSELGIYTLAYCISQLLFIDKTWTQETVFKRLSQMESKELYALCMCCNFGYVYQNVISFITSNKLFEKIAGLIKTEEPNADNAFSYINYIVAAYYFGFMDESDLHSFIQSLPEEHVNHLMWSCIGGIKGGSFDQQKELLKTIYYIYCKTHSDNTIHTALIKNISRFSYLDEDCWKLIYEALQNIQTRKNIWEDVRDCLERTFSKINTVIIVIKYLMDSGIVPDVYTIKNIMFISQNIGMPDLVKDIARYAMDHCIATNEMSAIYQKPEEILHCSDAELYKVGWIGNKNDKTC